MSKSDRNLIIFNIYMGCAFIAPNSWTANTCFALALFWALIEAVSWFPKGKEKKSV